jgi:hypothetical protein
MLTGHRRQDKMATENVLRIQHQNSSDDDGIPSQIPIMHHQIAAGIHMAHKKIMAHAEVIELKSFPVQHQKIPDQECSVKTTSTSITQTCSDRDTTELETSRYFDKDDTTSYKRSHSYHGKSSKGLFQVVVSLVVVIKMVLSLYFRCIRYTLYKNILLALGVY